jgi:hypothetical protein
MMMLSGSVLEKLTRSPPIAPPNTPPASAMPTTSGGVPTHGDMRKPPPTTIAFDAMSADGSKGLSSNKATDPPT